MKSRFRLIFLLLLVTAGVLHADIPGAEEAIADVWLIRAVELLEADDDINWEGVAEALDIAGEYRRSSSDAMYLEARLIMAGHVDGRVPEDSAPTEYARKMLAGSLEEIGSGDIVHFRDKAVAWMAVSLRLKDYRAVRGRYREWPAGEKTDPVLIYGAARAALYLGYNEEAAELAARGESLSRPGDGLNPGRIDLSSLSEAFDQPAVSMFRALAVAAGDESATETLDSAAVWGSSLNDALLPWILSGYINTEDLPVRELGGDLAETVMLLEGTTDIIPPGLQWDLNLRRILRDSRDDDHLEDGLYAADYDYDGFVEERLEIRQGKPVSRSLDADQNGSYEWYLMYESGKPVQIILAEKRLTVNYRSDAWPEVLSMQNRVSGVAAEFSFRPGAMEWNPFAGDTVWSEPAGMPETDDDFWNAVGRVKATYEFADSFPAPAEGTVYTYLADGRPILAREFRYAMDGSGSPLWVREIVFENGLEKAGRRSLRTDEDGQRLWELYERFENGLMVGLAWDPGMTGSPTYLADWALDRVLEVQAWDPDGDGWMDYRRFVLPDGRESSGELLVTEAGSSDLLPWDVSDWYPWEF